MSTPVFPPDTVTPRLRWNNTKTAEFRTRIAETTDKRETRISNWTYPRWRWKWTYLLEDTDARDELHAVLGFFLSRHGAFDPFFIRDSEDYAVTDQAFGVGDGVTTQFQLVREYGSFVEPVYGVRLASPAPVIKVDGTPTAATVAENGVVTFSAAPAADTLLTWTAEFYYRVRFSNDESEYEQFLAALWELAEIEMVSVGDEE